MELALYQTQWHGVSIGDADPESKGKVADPSFYSAFYRQFLSSPIPLAEDWVNAKKKLAAWLSREFLRGDGTAVLSVGAGLGTMEAEIDRLGHQVDIVECGIPAVVALKNKIPKARGIVADARHLPCRSGIYDLAYLSAADYCFTRTDYVQVLAEMGRALKPEGRAVSVCVSNLSFKGLLKGVTKRAFGLAKAGHALLWGYQRSVAEHLRAGENAGLSCNGVYFFSPDFSLTGKRTPVSKTFRWMTLRDHFIAFEFSRSSQ